MTALYWPQTVTFIYFSCLNFRSKSQRAVSPVLLWWRYCYSYLQMWALKRCCEIFTEEVSVLLSVNSILYWTDVCVHVCVCQSEQTTCLHNKLREALLHSHCKFSWVSLFVCYDIQKGQSFGWHSFFPCVWPRLFTSALLLLFSLLSLCPTPIFFLDFFTTYLLKVWKHMFPYTKYNKRSGVFFFGGGDKKENNGNVRLNSI